MNGYSKNVPKSRVSPDASGMNDRDQGAEIFEENSGPRQMNREDYYDSQNYRDPFQKFVTERWTSIEPRNLRSLQHIRMIDQVCFLVNITKKEREELLSGCDLKSPNGLDMLFKRYINWLENSVLKYKSEIENHHKLLDSPKETIGSEEDNENEEEYACITM